MAIILNGEVIATSREFDRLHYEFWNDMFVRFNRSVHTPHIQKRWRDVQSTHQLHFGPLGYLSPRLHPDQRGPRCSVTVAEPL
jgi:hypothetical protein